MCGFVMEMKRNKNERDDMQKILVLKP